MAQRLMWLADNEKVLDLCYSVVKEQKYLLTHRAISDTLLANTFEILLLFAFSSIYRDYTCVNGFYQVIVISENAKYLCLLKEKAMFDSNQECIAKGFIKGDEIFFTLTFRTSRN